MPLSLILFLLLLIRTANVYRKPICKLLNMEISKASAFPSLPLSKVQSLAYDNVLSLQEMDFTVSVLFRREKNFSYRNFNKRKSAQI